MEGVKLEKFLKKYDEMLPIYNEMVSVLEDVFSEEIGKKKYNVESINFRIKTKNSLAKKIQNKGMKYKRLSDITDVVGTRIVTFMDDQVSIAAEKVRKFFVVDEKNTIDKRKILDPRSFGYASLHYVVSFPEEKKYELFKGLRFEIQIRSLLQHTWATIEHDLGYKSRIGIPDELIRSFSRVSSLLELADKEFVNIKKDLIKYEEKVYDIIKSGKEMPENTPLNNITIKYFLEKNTIFNRLFKEILLKSNLKEEIVHQEPAELIKLLNYFKIKHVGELETILQLKKKEIIFITNKTIVETEEKKIEKKRIFYSVAYVLLGGRPLNEKINFLNLFKVLTDDERTGMAQTMENYHLNYKAENKKKIKYSLKNIILKNKGKMNKEI